MVWIMSIRFVGQALLSAGVLGGRELHTGMGIALFGDNCVVLRVPGVAGVHSVEDFQAIGADSCPKAWDFVCHLGVDFWAIGADGCPEAGDFVCHSGVDVWAIGADGCLKVGDFVCHSGVDVCCPEAGDLGCHLGVDLFFIEPDKTSSLGEGGFSGRCCLLSAFCQEACRY
jgi:hypothetical protein